MVCSEVGYYLHVSKAYVCDAGRVEYSVKKEMAGRGRHVR